MRHLAPLLLRAELEWGGHEIVQKVKLRLIVFVLIQTTRNDEIERASPRLNNCNINEF